MGHMSTRDIIFPSPSKNRKNSTASSNIGDVGTLTILGKPYPVKNKIFV